MNEYEYAHQEAQASRLRTLRRMFPARHMRVIREREPGQDDLEYIELFERVMVAATRGDIVVLVGPRGRGKTQLATDVGCAFVGRRRSAEYWRFADFAADFRHQCFEAQKSEVAYLRECAKADLLVLDEFQDAAGSEFNTTLLTRLVDHRYAAMKPTVLLSNLKPEELRKQLGASVASRLLEAGTVIEMTGRNFRTEAAERAKGKATSPEQSSADAAHPPSPSRERA